MHIIKNVQQNIKLKNNCKFSRSFIIKYKKLNVTLHKIKQNSYTVFISES